MEIFEHGGNERKFRRQYNSEKKEWLDFSANINPLGLPEIIKHHIVQNIHCIEKYPDPQSLEFIESIGQRYNKAPENIIVGNGASELFFLFVRTIDKPRVLIVTPSYSDYQRAAMLERREITFFELNEEDSFQLHCELLGKKLKGNEIVFLGRPNNPTGTFVSKNEILNLVQSSPESFFIIDEAFIDFMNFPEESSEKGQDTGIFEISESLCNTILPNLIVVFSLTKMYSLAGLRSGFAIGPEFLVERAKSLQSSWPVNTFAQNVGSLIMQNRELFYDYPAKTRSYINQQRIFLLDHFNRIPQLKIFPSMVNFILVKIKDENSYSEKLYDYLLKSGIIIRPCSNFQGLDSSYYRIAVLDSEANSILVKAVGRYFNDSASISSTPKISNKNRKTPALMILGTGSNVGKSLLATAFCRIFLNEGLRVFPFKSQNMSLNSCVTRDGREISRAQYLQAQAARVDPDSRMNPVLLKPVGKSSSQVILLGKPVGNMGYLEYRDKRENFWKTSKTAYDELAANADLMILEGAGSPVEMNLKKRDIVNMQMADYADASVLLACNIDFGGIYASLAGTLMLLDQNEKKRIAGLVINQFRGDESLFAEGRQLLEKITGKSVFGVIPFVDKLSLPDEDSMAFGVRENLSQNKLKLERNKLLYIYVIKLPHMSNFTDYDPFFEQGEIDLVFLESPPAKKFLQNRPEAPDALIIPGSKNVIMDMKWLDQQGISNYIYHLRENTKTEIIGLCGGFQMLGKTICDPLGIESSHGKISGLNLLDMTTELGFEKMLRRFSGKHLLSNIPVHGYEIHHGITTGNENPVLESAEIAGFSSRDNQVWGSYVHGIFDSDEFRFWFINNLLHKKNLPNLENIIPYDMDSAIENFATIVKSHLDMDKIRKSVFG